jgi:hypothetical protein
MGTSISDETLDSRFSGNDGKRAAMEAGMPIEVREVVEWKNSVSIFEIMFSRSFFRHSREGGKPETLIFGEQGGWNNAMQNPEEPFPSPMFDFISPIC